MAKHGYDVGFGETTVQGVKFISTHKLQEEQILEFKTKDIRNLLSLGTSTILNLGFSVRQKTVCLPYGNAACCANHVLVAPRLIILTRDTGEVTFTCRFESSTGLDPLAFAENSILSKSVDSFGDALGKVLVDGEQRNGKELKLFVEIHHEPHRGGGSVFPHAFTFRSSRLFLEMNNHPVEAKESVDIYLQKMWSNSERVPTSQPVHGLIRLTVQESGILQCAGLVNGIAIP